MCASRTARRKVSLSFDATSRFVSFFEDPNATPVDGEPAGKDVSGRFRRRSDAVTVHFPARFPPPLPSPLYMVPTFRTSEGRTARRAASAGRAVCGSSWNGIGSPQARMRCWQ